MRQCLGDNVFVEVRQDAVAHELVKKRTAALQYMILNCSRRRVTVRLDFSLSCHIQLVFPEEIGAEQGEKAPASLVVELAVAPLQRRHALHVLRAAGERAYVRAEYSIVEAVDVDTQDEKDESHLRQYVAQSAVTYAGVVVPNNATCGLRDGLAPSEVYRWCADINRWSRQRHVWFVDPEFSPTPESLWGSSSPEKPTGMALPITWRHLSSVVDASWRFVDLTKYTQDMGKQAQTWNSGVLDQASWVCALDALQDQVGQWCNQWFGDRTLERLGRSSRLAESSTVVINLCPGGVERVSVVADLFVPVATTGGGTCGGLVCAWPHSGDVYAVLLQKAYAKLRGSYASIATVPTRRILQELTGRPTEQLFPSTTWDAAGGVIANTKTKLSRQCKYDQPSLNKAVLMVSFGAFDDHHCAFQVLRVESPCPGKSAGFHVRDPTNIFHQVMSTKFQLQLDVNEDDGACFVPEEVFVQLMPEIFELLVDHSFTWRRRRVQTLAYDKSRSASIQVAVSCASLQHLVVRCTAMTLAGTFWYGAITVTVDRIGDDDQWTRLDVKPREEDTDTDALFTQVSWTAPAGEYVVSFSMDSPWRPSSDAGSSSLVLGEHNAHENLSLLFRMLDQDMDGIVSKTELVDFLCNQERRSTSDPAVILSVDEFVAKYATGLGEMQGLTMDDLLQVYEAVAAAGDRTLLTKQSLDDRLARLIWSDLGFILGNNSDGDANSTTSRTSLDDVIELCCVVCSDRDDVVLATLS